VPLPLTRKGHGLPREVLAMINVFVKEVKQDAQVVSAETGVASIVIADLVGNEVCTIYELATGCLKVVLEYGYEWGGLEGKMTSKSSWQKIADMNDQAIRDILKEEGVSEDELDAEVEKLKQNQMVQSDVRSVLITPEIDKTLKLIFDSAKDTFGTFDNESLKKAEEAIWPR
jgi:hypothetical protein